MVVVQVVVDGLCDGVCDSVGDDAGDGVCDDVCCGDGNGKTYIDDYAGFYRVIQNV